MNTTRFRGASIVFEVHLNLDPQGTNLRDGTLLPTNDETALTLEPTMGFTENFALGFMFLNAWEPGDSAQFAGWRALPHFYAPKSWKLPLKLGLVAEFSFQSDCYEENTRRAEFRQILDGELERWELVFNPVFERGLHGPSTGHGSNFDPAMLVLLKRPVFSPSVEYYGEIDSINVLRRTQPEVHQLFPGRRLGPDENFQRQFRGGLRSRPPRPRPCAQEPVRVGLAALWNSQSRLGATAAIGLSVHRVTPVPERRNMQSRSKK